MVGKDGSRKEGNNVVIHIVSMVEKQELGIELVCHTNSILFSSARLYWLMVLQA